MVFCASCDPLRSHVVHREPFSDNMASWIEELFPPKFKVNDLFDTDEAKTIDRGSNERFRKIYEDVFEEMILNKKDQERSEKDEQEHELEEEVCFGFNMYGPWGRQH